MADLFADQVSDPAASSMDHRPLADRLRPQTLSEYVGQRHLLGGCQEEQLLHLRVQSGGTCWRAAAAGGARGVQRSTPGGRDARAACAALAARIELWVGRA